MGDVRWKEKFSGLPVGLVTGLAIALFALVLIAAVTPALAQQIITDGKTTTSLYTSGNTTTVISGTTFGNVAFNSFIRFNVDSGQVVNLVLPDSIDNLICYVNDEATTINGILNVIKGNTGQIGGNVYLVNPYGITLLTSGVINTGSLIASTPTVQFMNTTFFGIGNPNSVATDMVLNGTAPINPSASVANAGVINVIDLVKFDSGSAINSGVIYTDAVFQINDLQTGDVVNLNTVDSPDFFINNGEVVFIAASSGKITNDGTIYTKDAAFIADDIDISNWISASGGVAIDRATDGDITFYKSDLTSESNLYLTPCKLSKVQAADLVIGDSLIATPKTHNIYIHTSYHTSSDLALLAEDDIFIERFYPYSPKNIGQTLNNGKSLNNGQASNTGEVLNPDQASVPNPRSDFLWRNPITNTLTTTLFSDGCIAITAGRDIFFNPRSSAIAYGGDLDITAGNNIDLRYLSALYAMNDIALTAGASFKKQPFAKIKAGGNVIINTGLSEGLITRRGKDAGN